MHELALADAVVRAALRAADDAGIDHIARIVVKVGELQQIARELFEFSLINVVPAHDPRLREARFDVLEERVRFRCRSCGHEFGRDDAGMGLFDLDFTSPSDHIVLGVERGFPGEQFGIDPHRLHGIDMMSVAFFSGDAALPLRGEAATIALLELLAITRWGELDVLILDMPPGLGDLSLDVIQLLPGLEFLVVGTGSRVVVASVRRALHLFAELEVPMVGLLENMHRGDGDAVARLAAEFDVRFLGSVPYDPELDHALGDVAALRRTAMYEALRSLHGV